ncbi:protein CyaY [Marinobacterium zhoushanense]|uniref:Iron-sulfur cluster assembly protein CyaY n=1 Tax=Marinobacterium zhoushanense TaxID=1679163 RepID=A0ABQ1KI18_9GAMM|nr:iron donor protein CyaY [Marinobacterium zhoushanense]GGB97462.1 protein CyaY [Marinobacterium zhoushanense]
MTESEFMAQVDETLARIEEILDDAESDLDYETNGGMMTVKCENGSQIIFTRQPPLKQLWLATRTGGFHFDYSEEKRSWVRDSDGAELGGVLTQAFADQAGESLDFSDI